MLQKLIKYITRKIMQYTSYLYFRRQASHVHTYQMRVSDIMIPRKDIDAVDIKTDLCTLCNMFYKNGHKVLPVYSSTLDNIKGVIEVNKLVIQPIISWQSLIVDAVCIPQSSDINDVIYILTRGKINLLLVLDEYGGVDGMITPACILKKHNTYDETSIISLGHNKWLLNGRLHISIFERILSIKVDYAEVVTIGGYICSLIGRVPQKYEKIQSMNLIFTIQESDEKCIYSVICTKCDDQICLYEKNS